jgi:hypothetical protein
MPEIKITKYQIIAMYSATNTVQTVITEAGLKHLIEKDPGISLGRLAKLTLTPKAAQYFEARFQMKAKRVR